MRDFGEFVREENSYDYRLLQKNSREVVVGVERFEILLRIELPNRRFILLNHFFTLKTEKLYRTLLLEKVILKISIKV